MIEKITEEEIAGARVARLADRPNENSRYGGSVMNADQLKAAFDALPELICRKFNALIDSLSLAGGADADDIAELIGTDLEAEHSLADLFREIGDGGLAERLSLGEESLSRFAERLAEAVVGVSYEPVGGVLSFRRASGEEGRLDLSIEQLIVRGEIEGESLCLYMRDGERLEIPLGSLASALTSARIAAERAAQKVEEADTVVTQDSERLITSGAVKDAIDEMTLLVQESLRLEDAPTVGLHMQKGRGRVGKSQTVTYDITDTEVVLEGGLSDTYDAFDLPIATLSAEGGKTYRISAQGYGSPYPSGGYLRLSAYVGSTCLGRTTQILKDGGTPSREYAEPIVFTLDADGEVELRLDAFVESSTGMYFFGSYVLSANAILSDCSLLCEHHKEYRVLDFDRVDLYLPEPLPEDYTVLLTFRSNAEGSTLTYDADILWSGEDCTLDGVFIPRPDKLYDILLRYNGAAVRGFVSGVLT